MRFMRLIALTALSWASRPGFSCPDLLRNTAPRRWSAAGAANSPAPTRRRARFYPIPGAYSLDFHFSAEADPPGERYSINRQPATDLELKEKFLCYTPRSAGYTMTDQHIGDLKKWVAELARRDNEGETLRLDRAVELIGKNFGVQAHEVAILGLTSDERSLRFLAPGNLRTIGQVPLSSGNSVAARTFREKRAEVINHFTIVPHASVFEGVPLNEEQRTPPIQKIMSSPIMLGPRVIGVIQVSRKAKTLADAGADFTHLQLRELKTISDALAPCILLCNKD